MTRTASTILVLAFLAAAGTAYACTCGTLPNTKDEAASWIERSDLVALVLVTEHNSRTWIENDLTKSDSYVRASIVRRFKGLPENTEIYFDPSFGSSCAAHLQLRHTYLVFAQGPSPMGRFETSMCATGLFWADIDEQGYKEHNELLQRSIIPTIDAIEEALQ